MIRVVPASETAEAVAAELLADILRRRVDESRSPVSLVLSGGSTPRRLYEWLAREPGLDIPWQEIALFWGDERCVPPGDPRSNYGMTAGTGLLERPFASIHRMPGESRPEEGARAYEEGVVGWWGQEGVPRLDIVLLGLGTDGHTASMFAGSEALEEDSPLVVATETYDGTRRLTMALPLLAAARHLLFLVTGQDKAVVLQKVLQEKTPAEGDEVMPARALVQAIEAREKAGRPHPVLTWLVDESAAALIAARPSS